MTDTCLPNISTPATADAELPSWVADIARQYPPFMRPSSVRRDVMEVGVT